MNKNNLSHSGIFEITEYGNLPQLRCSENERGVLFVCVTSGKLRVVGTDREKALSQGECTSFSLGRGYKPMCDGNEPCEAIYIVADGSLVYDLMRFYGISDLMSVSVPSAPEALEEIHRRMDSGDESDAGGDIATAFHRFLFKLNRASRLGFRSGGTALEIKNYIDAHIEGKLTLDELSKMFFVSKTQIFRIFKEAYGIAPMQYFLKMKVELAKKMLEDGQLKISDIADALSFTDAKHFTKTFKRFAGELPRNWKKRALQNKRSNTIKNTEEI